jgi:hypothetical protein
MSDIKWENTTIKLGALLEVEMSDENNADCVIRGDDNVLYGRIDGRWIAINSKPEADVTNLSIGKRLEFSYQLKNIKHEIRRVFGIKNG